MLKSAPDREEFDLKGEDAVAQHRVEILTIILNFFTPQFFKILFWAYVFVKNIFKPFFIIPIPDLIYKPWKINIGNLITRLCREPERDHIGLEKSPRKILYREIRVAAVDESDNVPEGSPPAQMNVFVTDGEFGPLPTPAPQRAPPTPPPPDNSAAIIGSAIGGVS